MPDEVQKVLTFEIERDWDKSVVTCHGRLVAGATDEFFRAVKRRLLQDKLIVIDLADLNYVDSMGLGTLVRLYVSAKQEGCELQLLHLGKQMRNLIKLANLTAVFASAEEHGITIA
jgi:anti-sigma B factor antagonist